MRKGWLRPGEPADDNHTQYVMPDTFNPGDRGNFGHEVIFTPKNVQAPPELVNYTPATGEVHDVGRPAPMEHEQLSLRPTAPGPSPGVYPPPAPVAPRPLSSRGWAGGAAGAVGMGSDDNGDGIDDETGDPVDDGSDFESALQNMPPSVQQTLTSNPRPGGYAPGDVQPVQDIAPYPLGPSVPPGVNLPPAVKSAQQEALDHAKSLSGGGDQKTEKVQRGPGNGYDLYNATDPANPTFIRHVGPPVIEKVSRGTGKGYDRYDTTDPTNPKKLPDLGGDGTPAKPNETKVYLGPGKGYDVYDDATGKKTGHIGPESGDAAAGTPQDIEGYIRQAAAARGIDPDTAVRVAMSEGGVTEPAKQSNVVYNGQRERSYGPFQLNMEPGSVGDRFQKATGQNPANPASWKMGVDFALDEAAKSGWGQWHGAAQVGIGDHDGLNGSTPVGIQASPVSGAGGETVRIRDPKTGAYTVYDAKTNEVVGHIGPDGTSTSATPAAGANSRFRPVTDSHGNVITVDQATGDPNLISAGNPWKVVPTGNGGQMRVNIETGATQQLSTESSRQVNRSIFQVGADGKYQEVVRAPADLKVGITADGKRITTIDPDTGAGRIIWVEDGGGIRNIPGVGVVVPPGKKVTVQTASGPVIYDGGPSSGPAVRMQDIPAQPGRTGPPQGAGQPTSSNASRVVDTANAQPGQLSRETWNPNNIDQARTDMQAAEGGASTGTGPKVPSALELFGALDNPTGFTPSNPVAPGSGDTAYSDWRAGLDQSTGDSAGGVNDTLTDDQGDQGYDYGQTTGPAGDAAPEYTDDFNTEQIAQDDTGDEGSGDEPDVGWGQRIGRGADDTVDDSASPPDESTPSEPAWEPPRAEAAQQTDDPYDSFRKEQNDFDAWHDRATADAYLSRGLTPVFGHAGTDDEDWRAGNDEMTAPYSSKENTQLDPITFEIRPNTYTTPDDLAAGRRFIDEHRALDRERRIRETEMRLGIQRIGKGEVGGPPLRDPSTGIDPNANPVIDPPPPPPPHSDPNDFSPPSGGGDLGSAIGSRGAGSTSFGGVRGRLSGRLAAGRSLEGWEPTHAATSTDTLAQELASSTGAPPAPPPTPEPPAVGTGADSSNGVAGVPAGGWTPPISPDAIVGGGNKFGDSVSMEGVHKGTDLQAVKGTPTIAPVSGMVTRVEYKKQGLGLQVVIRDEQGQEHRLSHLDKASVKEGEFVEKGQPVGEVGESGTGATGPHLDYRVEQGGQEVNPEPMMGDLANLPPHPDTIQEDGSVGAAGAEVGIGRKKANKRHNPMNLDMHNAGVGNDLRTLAMNDQRSGDERPNFGPSGMWDQAGNTRNDFGGDWGQWGKAARKQGYFGVGADGEKDPPPDENPPEESPFPKDDPFAPPGGWDPGNGGGSGGGGEDPSNLGTIIPSSVFNPKATTAGSSGGSTGRSASSASGKTNHDALTAAEDQIAWDREKFAQQLAEQQAEFGQNLGWDQSKFSQNLTWQEQQWMQDLGFQKDKLNVEVQRLNSDAQAEYRRYQLNIQQAQTQRAAAVEEMRHNRAMEVLGRYQAQLDERNQALNRQQQRVLQGTYAQHRQADLQDSALKNPWVQSLTGMAPEYGKSGGPGWTPGATPNGYQTMMGGYTPVAPQEEPWEPIPTEPTAPGDQSSGTDPNDPYNVWLKDFLTQTSSTAPGAITNPNTPVAPITPITMPQSTVSIQPPGVSGPVSYSTLADAIYGEKLQGVGHYNIDQMSQDDLNSYLTQLRESGAGWNDPRIVRIMQAAQASGYDPGYYNSWMQDGNYQPNTHNIAGGGLADQMKPPAPTPPPDIQPSPTPDPQPNPIDPMNPIGMGQRGRRRRRRVPAGVGW